MEPIKPRSLEVFAYRVPLATPVRVSFGSFRDRPMVLVRIVDEGGAEGWGEIWSNWPAVGAEHRARLADDFKDRVLGRSFASPDDAFRKLTSELEVLALQTGEFGPIAQVLSGFDIALWDLAARRAGTPLHRFLGGSPRETVPVYATSINPDQPEKITAELFAKGHRAFKLKTGFNHERDIRNLQAMRDATSQDAVLTCDANQALSVDAAIAFARAATPIGLQWFEEPIRVDAPAAHWHALADATSVALAGGENLQGPQFDAAIADRALRVLQPDITKWGGITGNLHVAKATVAAGKRYCPHFFGGGVCILASLQVLAAAGGTGLLEYDPYANAGRELVVGDLLPVTDGRVPVPAGAGLGAVPDVVGLDRYRTWPPRH